MNLLFALLISLLANFALSFSLHRQRYLSVVNGRVNRQLQFTDHSTQSCKLLPLNAISSPENNEPGEGADSIDEVASDSLKEETPAEKYKREKLAEIEEDKAKEVR